MEVLTFRLTSIPFLFLILTSHLFADDSAKLLQELSPLVESIQKELNSDQQLASVRALLDALERNPNPNQAELLLREIERSEGLMTRFYEELTARVHSDPGRLQRIQTALAGVKNQMRLSKVVFPSFSRTWAGFGVLLASNDYLFSHFSTVSQQYTPDIGYYTVLIKSMFAVTLVNMGVAALADAIVLKKSVGSIINDFKERRKAKALTSELLNMVRQRAAAERSVMDGIAMEKGTEFALKNLSNQLIELLDIKDRASSAKLEQFQIVKKLQKYFAERRMHKVLAKVAETLTPMEVEVLNNHLKEKGAGLEFQPNPRILAAQKALYADFIAWESAHPDNNIRDLVAESIEAERVINTSRIVKLKPHWIASFNYFIIGFSLTIASDAATAGVLEMPFDNFVSTFLRTHRESITMYAGITGLLTYAVHLLAYPRIRKAEKRVLDPTLQPLKKIDRSSWEFFRRTAMLAQLDYEIAKPESAPKDWVTENAWSALRSILKSHDLVARDGEFAKYSCESTVPF